MANIITIDFETFYSSEFSLTKLSTEQYVRDDKFETIGFAYKLNDDRCVWVTGNDAYIQKVLDTLPWEDSLVLAHNTMFDGAILSWRYGVKPKGWLDTMSMGRALHGSDSSVSLKSMAERYSVGKKGTEVDNARGMGRELFSAHHLAEYGEYCRNDVQLTCNIFQMMINAGFPTSELRLIDLTLGMFIHPVLRLDTQALNAHLDDMVAQKKAHLVNALKAVGRQDLAVKHILGDDGVQADVRKTLMSNTQFATMLKGLNVEAPTKISPTTGKLTLALAKTDEGFKALLEHEDLRVQALCAARIGTKSTLEETRTQRFLDIAGRGLLPIPLKYYAAHTGRWGGTDSVNLQNLPSRGANAGKLKKAIQAPEGYVFIDSDSSQIEARTLAWEAGQDDLVEAFAKGEDVYKIMASAIYNKPSTDITAAERFVGKTTILGCFGADTLVLTTRGWVPIIHVQATDMVWEGLRWVQHGGVVDRGEKDVWTYKGISATSDHEILTEHGWEAWSEVTTKTFLWQSARSVANLLSLSGGHIKIQGVGTVGGILFANVHAGGSGLYCGRILLKVAVLGATLAPKLRRILNAIGRMKAYAQMKLHELDFSTVSHLAFPGVTIPTSKHTHTTVVAEYTSTSRGELIGSLFSGISSRWKGMTPKILRWTGLMWIGGTSRVIFALWGVQPTWQIGVALGTCKIGSPPLKQRMQTYDIAYSGPRNRYTILSADGPLVVHNCGYGMGGPKFQAQLRTFGTTIETGEAAYIVGTYRTTYPKIPQLWREAHEALRCMVKGMTMNLCRDDLLTVDAQGILLPNGLHIFYNDLQEVVDADGKKQFVYQTRKGANKIYGGKVVENFTQAIARCIIGDQMRKIAKRYRVVLTVHDAIGIVARHEEADEARDYVESCMRWVPSWAQGLPVNCESGMGASYGDC
jgi:hypothetical protein